MLPDGITARPHLYLNGVELSCHGGLDVEIDEQKHQATIKLPIEPTIIGVSNVKALRSWTPDEAIDFRLLPFHFPDQIDGIMKGYYP